jgi:hypothetical protein
MDHRQIVRMLACARMAIGVVLVAAPRRGGGRWVGDQSDTAAAKVMIRAVGARDMALGLGTYHALATGEPVRPWVLGGLIGDLTDAVATTLALRQLGLRRSVPVVLVAAASAAYATSVADQIDLAS